MVTINQSINQSINQFQECCSKFVLTLFVLFTFLFTTAGIGTASALTQDGDGYYMIATSADLAVFRVMVNAGSADLDAKLSADIDMGGGTWTPIGADPNYYSGTFDGNGKSVAGLKIIQAEAAAYGTNWIAGFFGALEAGASVRNLTLASCLAIN